MSVITRFAPSPTGYLHIGGARTALFNYLFAKHHGGKFYLRIEDTDRARSTQPAVEAIIDGLQWLGLHWDGEVVHQFARSNRHAEVARELVERGAAYYCYMTPQEIEAEREKAKAEKKIWRYDNRWRDRPASDAPKDIPPAIRIKAPLEGEITIEDAVQGSVTVPCKELDDMVLLRADGTPTYMLAVVVDDHDMHITHVVRGDDHFTNSFRQTLIYRAMGWDTPQFAHIPLIHGPDGAKLSKRHGALGVDAYRDMGYLPEALRNYLLRLGWSHGDDEIISDAQAAEWFNLESIGKSPSRFDFAKLENLNGHYLREADDARLVELIWPRLFSPSTSQGEGRGEGSLTLNNAGKDATNPHPIPLPEREREYNRLLRGMAGLKARAKTLVELTENARFYVESTITPDEKAKEALAKSSDILSALLPQLQALSDWTQPAIEAIARAYAESSSQKLGNVAQPLRAALTGKTISPSVFEVMEVLGKEESLQRLQINQQ